MKSTRTTTLKLMICEGASRGALRQGSGNRKGRFLMPSGRQATFLCGCAAAFLCQHWVRAGRVC